MMANSGGNWFSSRLKSFRNAFHGILLIIKSQENFKIQLSLAFVACLLGLLLSISTTEWLVIVMVIGLVLAFEAMNTSMELLSDKVESNYSEEIKKVKDASAGAVLIISIAALIIGATIFLPKLYYYFDLK